MNGSSVFGVFICLLLTSLAIAKPLTSEERIACTRGLICTVKKETLDFLVVGDTGGISFDISEKLKFMGITHATQTQIGVAMQMASLAGKTPQDFIVNVGDNVYWNGVENVKDPRFQIVFEQPYSHKNLQVPWYMIAGNHDHLGNIEAQLEYTKHSNKWTFPNYFYKASYAFGSKNTNVELIFIDTVVLCGQSIDVEGRSLFHWMTAWPLIPKKPAKKHEKLAKDQWDWIEEQLKTSTAEYLFVVGHYPVYSIAQSPLKCLESRLDPLMRKYNASAYLSGHEHSLQYFLDKGDKSGSEMRYIISGAGSRTGGWGLRRGEKTTRLVYHYPKIDPVITELGLGLGGFVQFAISENEAKFKFYGRGIQMIHEASLKPRKIKK